MITRKNLIAAVLAAWDGSSAQMSMVEAALAQKPLDDPMAELQRLGDAIQHDLAALPLIHAYPPNIRVGGLGALAPQLGWLVATLRAWTPSQDPNGRRLSAALLAASEWNIHGNLWPEIKPLIQDWTLIRSALPLLIDMRIAVADLPNGAPIWQQELLVAFRDAELRNDWEALSDMSASFPKLRFDAAAEEAVRALWEVARPELVAVADQTAGWLRATQFVAALRLEDALALALASTNSHVRFAALELAKTRAARAFQPGEAHALEQLLVDLAQEIDAWPSWLATFNTHPVRVPAMQQPLGRALARSSKAAARAYVMSIELSTSGLAGAFVAECLSEFAATAPDILRHHMWRLCHERWRSWNFGSDKGTDIAGIGRSELDYGVIGWLVECAGPAHVDAEMDSFAERLRALENEWHASPTALRSAFNRLLSRHQLLAHATTSASDRSDWFPNQQVYVPETLTDPYTRARHPLPQDAALSL